MTQDSAADRIREVTLRLDAIRFLANPGYLADLTSPVRLASIEALAGWARSHASVHAEHAPPGMTIDPAPEPYRPSTIKRGRRTAAEMEKLRTEIIAVAGYRTVQFGDHDPSGVDIERSLRESLRRYAPAADITFERVAVTAEEIESVPVEVLRRWCREVIEQHVDPHQLDVLRVAEASERSILLRLAGGAA